MREWVVPGVDGAPPLRRTGRAWLCDGCGKKQASGYGSAGELKCAYRDLGCEWGEHRAIWRCTKCNKARYRLEAAHERTCVFRGVWERGGRPRHAVPTIDDKDVSKAQEPSTGDKTAMRDFVKLYRDGDEVAIQTNITGEAVFMREVTAALGEKLADATEDATTLLRAYIPQIVDLCAKMRGYKAPLVDEQIVLTAGRIQPSDALLWSVSEDRAPAVAAA